MTATIATDWVPFDRANPNVAVDLLGRIRDRTANAWLTVEPRPDEDGHGRLLRKRRKSAYSVTISPFAEDDEPHFMLYLVFPKGARFGDRGFNLPASVTVDDESKDDAMLRVAIETPPGEVVSLAMASVESCSDSPLGDEWRAALGDTYVSPMPR